MKIGIVDVDAQSRRKNRYGGSTYPNLALCKIAAYHKAKGDTVEWAVQYEHYDMLYMSKVFNFTPDDLSVYDADVVVKGGTGYDIRSTLPPEIDMTQPDLTIYPGVPKDVSYGFLTRGCPNRCPWCVVPKKEGKIRPYMDIEQVAAGKRKVILMDNNILAAGDYALEQFRKIKEMGIHVDFNQGLDARLVDERWAWILSSVKWIRNTVRFGCDTKRQIDDCERVFRMMDDSGFHGTYFLYTIIGSDLVESYNRINHFLLKNDELHSSGKPRRYLVQAQPYRDPYGQNSPPQWQKDMAGWANNKSIFNATGFADFEPRKGFKCGSYLEQYGIT